MTAQTVQSFLTVMGVKPGSRVTAAVSGGADSMALLTALLQCKDALGITVCAAHFNHGLRGGEAARDEDFVKHFCQAHGVSLTVGRGDVKAHAKKTGQSIEEAARSLRYAFFDGLDTDYIATAHTADDNAETLLLHLLRGTGVRGLCGIPARRGGYLRPLLTVSRIEIEQYLNSQGVPHIEDSTNADDDCVRNRLRHRVIPELMRENPRFLSAVSRTTALVAQEDAYLSRLAGAAAEDCRADGGYDCKKLRALDPVLLRRVLLGLLREQALEDPSARYVEALERLVFTDDPSASVCLPDSLRSEREYDLLRFTREKAGSFAPVRLPVPGTAELSELGLTVSCSVSEGVEYSHKKPNTIFLRYDMTADTVLLRPRRSGDTVLLPGGTKTVKKLMIDRKLPAKLRGQVPIVEISEQIAAVGTLAISRNFLPDSDHPVLVIEWQRRV